MRSLAALLVHALASLRLFRWYVGGPWFKVLPCGVIAERIGIKVGTAWIREPTAADFILEAEEW